MLKLSLQLISWIYKSDSGEMSCRPNSVTPQTDLASEEKKRLEEKQRAARKNRSKADEEWKSR